MQECFVEFEGSSRRGRLTSALVLMLVVAVLVAITAPADAARGGKKAQTADTTETSTTDASATETSTTDGSSVEPADATTDTTVTATTSPSTDDSPKTRTGKGPSQTEVTTTTYDPSTDRGSLYTVADKIGARALWERGITGAGVQVAVIDTGVAPVPALTGANKVVAMVDLSLEAGVPEAVYLDTNGHGSHMAGIIAGRTPDANPAEAAAHPEHFFGIAPDAGIVSVKVGDNTGAVDVSQVIAAIDWVIAHHDAPGFNIRVINLSYGTDSTQPYEVDPLAYAVERAWHAGIVVVVAAGNEGWQSGVLANPAKDPYVIAVAGAEIDSWGEYWLPSWSSSGDGQHTGAANTTAHTEGRNPDLAAPGVSIVSLRVPGSRVAFEHPESYVTDDYAKGSGTSQAAAVVSGAVALLLDARPDLTPDQVKALLQDSAQWINGFWEAEQGAGVIDIDTAVSLPTPRVVQSWTRSDGSGSLEAARGTHHITIDGEVLTGEVTVNGASWSGTAWTDSLWSEATWTGSSWSGASWSGASWSGASWSGSSWSGSSWSGSSWSGSSWSGSSWSGSSWSGSSWSGSSWSGSSWSGASWSGASWSDVGWY